MPQPKIRLFWDLETCPLPISHASPWEKLKNIRQFTGHFGVVTNIKAYWDRNKAHNAAADGTGPLRAAMISMGINLVDCSLVQGYTEDSLTRMLGADVLVSAIDEPINESDIPTRDIIMIFSGDEGILYPISLLMFRNYTVFLVVPDENTSIQQFQATRIFNWHGDVLCSRLRETTSIRLSASEFSKPRGENPHVPYVLKGPHARRPTSPLSTSTSTHPSAYPSSSKPATSGSTPAATPKSSVRSLPTSEYSASRAPSVLSKAPVNGFGGASHGGGSTSVEPEESVTYAQGASCDWGSDGGWNAGGSWAAGGDCCDWAADGDWETASSDRTSERAPEPKTRKPKPDTSKGSGPSRQPEPVNVGPDPEPRSEVPKEVPMSAFEPLVQVLRESKKRSMGRSKLGEELSKHKSTYKAAGVKGFAEYIALAVSKEIVVAGGTDNNLYVRLHPKVKNAQ